MTGIEWTDKTWNPATGCTKVSAGCKNCYAERVANRLQKWGNKRYANGFEYTEHLDKVGEPRKWKKPCKIFVNSMSDLFHEDATDDFLTMCFETMDEADHHIYQILTKRPKAMSDFVYDLTDSGREGMYVDEPLRPHIWCGTSVEDANSKHRIDDLVGVRAQIRFISFEPLIGPVGEIDLRRIAWIIIGGESGPGHRPIKGEWVRDIIRQARRDGCAVFFKQWGGATAKSGGCELDGKVIQEYPQIDWEQEGYLGKGAPT